MEHTTPSPSARQRLVAFDIEATGLEPQRDRIVEFCFVDLDEALQPTESFKSLIDPGMPMPPEITAIVGISDDDLKGQPKFEQFAARIQEIVDTSILVAHNSRFDLAILNYELVRAGQAGVSPNHAMIDTHAIEASVNGHNLAALYQRYSGKPMEGIHRAEADTMATIEILRGQREKHAAVLGNEIEGLLLEKMRQSNGSDGRVYYDHSRRFVQEKDGVVRLNFGKHRGAPVSEHHDFLRWMLKADFPDDTKKAAKGFLKIK